MVTAVVARWTAAVRIQALARSWLLARVAAATALQMGARRWRARLRARAWEEECASVVAG
jgi:hypothetical protein